MSMGNYGTRSKRWSVDARILLRSFSERAVFELFGTRASFIDSSRAHQSCQTSAEWDDSHPRQKMSSPKNKIT